MEQGATTHKPEYDYNMTFSSTITWKITFIAQTVKPVKYKTRLRTELCGCDDCGLEKKKKGSHVHASTCKPASIFSS